MRFSDFVTISPSTKKEIELVVSIFEDGTFSLNSYLLKYFPQYTAEIKLKDKKKSFLYIIWESGMIKMNGGLEIWCQ